MARQGMGCGTMIVLVLVGSVLAVLLISRMLVPPPPASPSHFKPAPRKASRPEPTSSQVKAREEAEAKQVAAQEQQRKREEAKRRAAWEREKKAAEARRQVALEASKAEAREEAPQLPHRIVERYDCSYGGCRRMVYRVLVNVESIPSETALKRLAAHLWKSGNQEWDEFSVWIFLPGMDVESIWYAGAEYRPHGLKEFRVQKWALEETKWER